MKIFIGVAGIAIGITLGLVGLYLSPRLIGVVNLIGSGVIIGVTLWGLRR